jgi:hypothetical protein
MEKFKSLYDYLGRAAGKELGNQVFKAAKAAKIPVMMKEVSNPVYKGKIMMYPENWLIGYFSTGQSNFGVHEIEISLNDMLDKIYG